MQYPFFFTLLFDNWEIGLKLELIYVVAIFQVDHWFAAVVGVAWCTVMKYDSFRSVWKCGLEVLWTVYVWYRLREKNCINYHVNVLLKLGNLNGSDVN